MKFLLKLIMLQFIFISASSAKSELDRVTSRFYTSLENFLEENFENTDFSIKKIESIKPEIGIQTFKKFSESDNDLSFFQGNVVKYVCRYQRKGGAEDIKKIIHYCQLELKKMRDTK